VRHKTIVRTHISQKAKTPAVYANYGTVMFNQGSRCAEQAAVAANNDGQVNIGTNRVSGLHRTRLKVRKRGQTILQDHINATSVQEIEKLGNHVGHPWMLSASQQSYSLKLTHDLSSLLAVELGFNAL
jgi:Zn-dependent membrane protease YugP